ncbi:MAG: sodium:solute symporter family protein [Cyanobacteria bacterium]|nr:sodium:solute symporter family protein [Cyanobacteriota bacterium]MDA1020382.1 sodium:solute symporter family protein [Cyanobacteriota bacterium]
MINLSIVDYAILIGYFVLVFAIGFFVKNEQGDDLENYFLAGRKLTLPLFVATLVTTWYGNLLSVGELAFKQGLVMWLTQGLFWYFTYFFVAFFLAEKIHKTKLFSIPDQLEASYDKATALLGAGVNLLLMVPAVYILSLAYICELIFGWDKISCVLVGTLIPLLYMIKGGFKAVVYTDFIQFIFMFLGIAFVIPFAYFKYGGFEFLTANLPSSHLSLTGEWSWQLILAWFLIAMWAIVHPSFYQRIFASPDLKTAKQGILWSIGFWFIFDMMINLVGLYAFAAMPDLEPATSLLVFSASVLPVVFKGIFFTGLVATVMSTLDSLGFSSAMSVSYDIFLRVKKDLSHKQVININKWALVFILGLGIIIAIYFESLIELMYVRGTIAISALLVPLLASYFPNIIASPPRGFSKQSNPRRAGFWSMLAGILGASLGYFLKQYCGLELEPIFLGLVLSLLCFVFKQKS